MYIAIYSVRGIIWRDLHVFIELILNTTLGYRYYYYSQQRTQRVLINFLKVIQLVSGCLCGYPSHYTILLYINKSLILQLC